MPIKKITFIAASLTYILLKSKKNVCKIRQTLVKNMILEIRDDVAKPNRKSVQSCNRDLVAFIRFIIKQTKCS